MKYLNIALCVVMILFAAVQYNDPDAPVWIVIYLVPAFWAGLVAFRLPVVRDTRVFAALCATLVLAVVLTVSYWPDVPNWWREEVWWKTETAREGMGVMIATVSVAIALLTAVRARARRARTA